MAGDVKSEARSLLEWLSGWGDGPNWSDASGATVPVVKESLRRVLEHVVSPKPTLNLRSTLEERAAWDTYVAHLASTTDTGPACHDSSGHSRAAYTIAEAAQVADELLEERRKRWTV